MRRTRRAAAPDAASPETTSAETLPDAPDASPVEQQPAPADISIDNAASGDTTRTATQTEEGTPAPKRASRRKTAKAAAEAPVTESSDADATPKTAAPEVKPAPRRRAGTRAAAKTKEPAETAADPELQTALSLETEAIAEAPVVEAVQEPQPTSSRRRSRRGRGGSAAAPVETGQAEMDAADLAVAQDGGALEPPAATESSPARSSRRSRRRERTAPSALTTEEAIALAGLSDFVTPVTSSAAPEDAPASPRKGRSRRRRSGPEAGESALPSEPKAASAETPEEPSDDTGKRSRRRRGRRRKGGPDDSVEVAESSELLVGGEILPVEETEAEEEEADLVPLTPISVPVYVAPPLVPPVYRPEGPARPPRIHASVVPVGASGHRNLLIDEASYNPFLFFVNTETAHEGDVVEAQIREAAANGVHLYSAVMYLPLKNIYGERPFGRIDALVGQILAADPNAYILPRLQLVPTNYWARTHTNQLAKYAGGEEGDVSIASREFWADCVEAVEALIEHFSDPATHGGDRIVGFHIDRGEWFHDAEAGYDYSEPNVSAFRNWLRARYQFDFALKAAWYDGKVTFDTAEIPARSGATVAGKKSDTPLLNGPRDGRWVDYARYSSEIVAEAITGVAAAIKTLSARQLLVAVSYGYTLEFATRNDSGHLALGRLLGSPDIDIVAGPNSYTSRGAGNTGAFGAPLDSVILHGKLWIVEDDTKTYLAHEETDDTYNPKIASGVETQATHERHFGAALAHRAGVAWMDLWGHGWLNNPAIWEAFGGMTDLAARWAQACAARYGADERTPAVAAPSSIPVRGRDEIYEQGLDPDEDSGEEYGAAHEPAPEQLDISPEIPAEREEEPADQPVSPDSDSEDDPAGDILADEFEAPATSDEEPVAAGDGDDEDAVPTDDSGEEPGALEYGDAQPGSDDADEIPQPGYDDNDEGTQSGEDEPLENPLANGDAEEIDFEPVCEADEIADAPLEADDPEDDADEFDLPAIAIEDAFLDADQEWPEDDAAPEPQSVWCGAPPDVIAFVDEASLFYLKNDPAGLGQNLVGRTREMLLRTGAAVGFFLQSDVTLENLPDATLYLFLNPLRITTAERQAIRERLQRRGKTLAWLYAPGIFDENGPSTQDVGEVIGITLRRQPWNTRVGSQIVEQRHPITERLRSGKRIGQEETLNPSFAVNDPQATVLAEYVSSGSASIAIREHAGGWRSVFFGEPHMTVELLRGLFTFAGVPLYSTQDDVVHAAADGVVMIHAGYTGQRVINLPRPATVYDATDNRIISVQNRSFRTFLRARTSRLFLFGESDEIAAFTGLEIPTEPIRPQRSEHPPREQSAVEDEGAESAAEFRTAASAMPRVIPGLEDVDELDADIAEEAAPPSDEDAPPPPRSRWQRRRAAARARREAERRAKEEGQSPQPPVDLTSLLPDLPPRRKPAEADPAHEQNDSGE